MKYIITFIFSTIILSCSQTNNPSIEKSIKETLNKKVNLSVFDMAYTKDRSSTMDALREQYDFISIVYLKDGCAPCYPNYIKWHNKLDSIGGTDKHTVLFIIEGNIESTYENFIVEASKYGNFNNRYFTVIDTNYLFLDGNSEIPYNHISNSLLINKENKVKLIGPPFVNNEMTKLFHRIINE